MKSRTMLDVILSLGIIALILFSSSLGAPKSRTGGGSPAPGFYVVVADQNIRIDAYYFTLYTFRMTPLFWEMFDKYDGDLMLLIRNCSGASGQIIICETNTGKNLVSFMYEGNSLIALGGQETVVSFKGQTISDTWSGMTIAAKDWKAGTWTPENGIMVVHTAAQILGDAELFMGYIV